MNQIVNNLKEGYWEIYDTDGNLWYKGNYKSGIIEGYWEWYYSNGKLRYKGNYISDKLDGYWEEYSNGKLEIQVIFI